MFLLKQIDRLTETENEIQQRSNIKTGKKIASQFATHRGTITKTLIYLSMLLTTFFTSFFVFKIFDKDFIYDAQQKQMSTQFGMLLGYNFLFIMIIGVLSLCLFNLSWLLAPLFFTSVGLLLGEISVYSFFSASAQQNKIENFFENPWLVFIALSTGLLILTLNLMITLFNYYKIFKNNKQQQIMNKISFVAINFVIVTIIYSIFISILVFAMGDEKITMSTLVNPYYLIGLFIVSGSIAFTTIYIITALMIFDSIVNKQVDKKYEFIMALALCFLVLWPIFKALLSVFKRKK